MSTKKKILLRAANLLESSNLTNCNHTASAIPCTLPLITEASKRDTNKFTGPIHKLNSIKQWRNFARIARKNFWNWWANGRSVKSVRVTGSEDTKERYRKKTKGK